MDKTAAESNLKAERHRNLKIWQEATTLENEVHTITRAFPRDGAGAPPTGKGIGQKPDYPNNDPREIFLTAPLIPRRSA